MTINGDVAGGVRGVPEGKVPVQAGRAGASLRASTHSASVAVPRSDGVEVSEEGRALARSSALTPERIDEVRQRILQGAYDQAGVIEAVARRILLSGDL